MLKNYKSCSNLIKYIGISRRGIPKWQPPRPQPPRPQPPGPQPDIEVRFEIVPVQSIPFAVQGMFPGRRFSIYKAILKIEA